MDDNLPRIVASLKRIQTEGRRGNFVILLANEEKNYFIQFSASPDTSIIYSEAVSNDYLMPEYSLSSEQIANLLAIGWKHTNEQLNFFREWEVKNDDERLSIAIEVMRTFLDVYGISNEQYIVIKTEIESPSEHKL